MRSRGGVSQSPALLHATVTIRMTAQALLCSSQKRAGRQQSAELWCSAARCCREQLTNQLEQPAARAPAGYDICTAVHCDTQRRLHEQWQVLSSTSKPRRLWHRFSRPRIALRKPQHLVVLRGANERLTLQLRKDRQGRIHYGTFFWGVVDWAHPPWYDVVLDAFRG